MTRHPPFGRHTRLTAGIPIDHDAPIDGATDLGSPYAESARDPEFQADMADTTRAFDVTLADGPEIARQDLAARAGALGLTQSATSPALQDGEG